MNKTDSSHTPARIDDTINSVAALLRATYAGQEWKKYAFLSAWIVIASPIVTLSQDRLGRYFVGCVGCLVYLPFVFLLVLMAVHSASWKQSDRQLNRHLDTLRADYIANRQEISPAALASLLDMIRWEREYNLAGILQHLLKDLLKSLRSEDAVLLTTDQRNVLHSFVWSRYHNWRSAHAARGEVEALHRELLALTVGVLVWLGDASSIPVLELVATKTDEPPLRAAALQSIEQIRQRLQYGAAEMLRAGRAPEHPDILLRPAASDLTEHSSPQELLRADRHGVDSQGRTPVSPTDEQPRRNTFT